MKLAISGKGGVGKTTLAAFLSFESIAGESPSPGQLAENRMILRMPILRTGFSGMSAHAAGVKVLRLPAKSPNLNAFAERFVLSIRTECLNRIVPLGEAHLRRAIGEFVQHYHHERNHQGLDNALIAAEGAQEGHGQVVRRDRLGGLLGFYHREAA